jgi:branched-chain amino acid aminotransferase
VIQDWVYINGEFHSKGEATVSVFDHGFIYGDGVFEGIAIASGGIFKLDSHIQRLVESATYLAIRTPDVDVLRDAALETARRNLLRDGYLRMVLTRGSGPVGIRNMDQLSEPTFVVIAQAEDRAKRQAVYDKGMSAVVSSVRRIPAECLDGKAKTCNYINNILAYLEARHAGADTAIMLDTAGCLAECYAANIFVVKNGNVRTPALGSILNGITRQTILTLCRELDIPCEQTRLTPHDLFCADEVFETGSLGELKPIRSITGRTVGSGKPGALSGKLHHALRALMESGRESTPV